MTTSALLINRDKWCFQAGAHGTQVGSWRRPLHSNLPPPPLLLLRNSCNNKLAHLASRHSHTIYLVCWHLALSSIYLSFMLILWYFSLFKDFLFWVIFLSDTDRLFLAFTELSPLYWVNRFLHRWSSWILEMIFLYLLSVSPFLILSPIKNPYDHLMINTLINEIMGVSPLQHAVSCLCWICALHLSLRDHAEIIMRAKCSN